jgi:hypothetical protein
VHRELTGKPELDGALQVVQRLTLVTTDEGKLAPP